MSGIVSSQVQPAQFAAAGCRWTLPCRTHSIEITLLGSFILGALFVSFPGLAMPPLEASSTEYAFVVTTDYYSAAYYSTVEVPPPRTTNINIAAVSTDPITHYDPNEHMAFVINRYLADNIQVVDPDLGFATVKQYSVGNGSNPHDIRLASSTKAYVSRFEWTTLLIVNPYTGDSLGTVDLSLFADSDGIPEMDRMEIVDGKLFITLNCIDHTTWLPNGLGKIAVVDVAADTLIDCDPMAPGVQPIALSLPNPYSELRYDPCRHELLIGCLGCWGVADGGVEAVDPVALESKGTVITEAEIGGDISDGLLGPDAVGYAVVLEPVPWPDNFARLVAFDRAGRQVIDTLYEQTSGLGSSLGTIELNRQGEVYLCDRDATSPGVRIFDISTGSMITKIDVGLPPFDLEFVQQPSAGISNDGETKWDGICDTGFTLAESRPNPFTISTDIAFTVPENTGPSRVSLAVYDPLGRLVRRLVDGTRPAGTHTTSWNGRDEYRREVASGVYFYRLTCSGASQTKRVVLMR